MTRDALNIHDELRLLRAVEEAGREYKERRGRKPFSRAKRAWLDFVEALDAVTRAEAAKDKAARAKDKAARAKGGW